MTDLRDRLERAGFEGVEIVRAREFDERRKVTFWADGRDEQ